MKTLLKTGKMQSFVCRLLMLALIFGELIPTLRVQAYDTPEEEEVIVAEDEEECEEAEEEEADPAEEAGDGLPADEEEEEEPADADGADVGVVFDVTYGQTEARKMSVSVNKLRKNNSAEDLTYDYGLEEKAILRATELAVVYGAQRPNGTANKTILSKDVTNSGYDELIYPSGKTTEELMERLLKSDSSKAKLLTKAYKYFAIGHVTVDEQNYWAIIFTNVLMKKDKTEANDKKKVEVTMNVADDRIQDIKVTPSLADKSKINIDYKKTTKLPTFTAKLDIKDHQPTDRALPIKNYSVKWALEDPTVAKIENNEITGLLDRGDTTLKATVTGCGKSKVFTYNVHTIIHPTSVTISPKTAKLDLDEELQLTYTVLPADADDKTVTFKAEPADSIVTVNAKGLVTAMSVGTAKVTVETVDGGKKDSCDISVTAEISVEKPKLSPEKEFYHRDDPIRLSSGTPGAEIYYTLDGSDPAYKVGTLYKEPFTLNESCVLKAVACKELVLEDKSKGIVSSNILSKAITVFPENWGDVTEEDRAQWASSDELPAGLWIAKASMPEPLYTGKAQKPDSFRVYFHNVRLQNKKDYTINHL